LFSHNRPLAIFSDDGSQKATHSRYHKFPPVNNIIYILIFKFLFYNLNIALFVSLSQINVQTNDEKNYEVNFAEKHDRIVSSLRLPLRFQTFLKYCILQFATDRWLFKIFIAKIKQYL
jgi:hypothetical protein